MAGVYTKKVLIIDTEMDIPEQLSRALSRAGIESFVVRDAEAVSREIMSVKPDLVVLDVGMQGMDGFAILETLRRSVDPLMSGMPVIVASKSGDLVEISRALKLNVKDYFVKSTFDVENVLSKILKHIGIDSTPTETTPTEIDFSRIKVLIVEDDKFLRDLAAQKLTKEHLQVYVAVDGEQGVALAEKEIPDIILLDILLPGIDGFEVLARVRANPNLAKTNIAMLSNFGQKEDVERAFNAGADQFLVKANYTLDEIVAEVKKIITKPREARTALPLS